MAAPPDPLAVYWRTGRHVGRTIYAMGGPEPSREDDVLIGVMDTPELAEDAVAAHNALLPRPYGETPVTNRGRAA